MKSPAQQHHQRNEITSTTKAPAQQHHHQHNEITTSTTTSPAQRNHNEITSATKSPAQHHQHNEITSTTTSPAQRSHQRASHAKEISTRYKTGWNVTKRHACHAKRHDNLLRNLRKASPIGTATCLENYRDPRRDTWAQQNEHFVRDILQFGTMVTCDPIIRSLATLFYPVTCDPIIRSPATLSLYLPSPPLRSTKPGSPFYFFI